MKNIFLFLALIAFVACKDDKKAEKNEITNEKTVVQEEEKEVAPAYPAMQKFDQQPVTLYQDLHVFDDKIKVEDVAIVPGTEENTHSFIFYFSDDTDFEMLQNYYIALMLYPEDVSTIEDKKDRDRGLITKSIKCEPVQAGKSVAVVLPDFKILGDKMKNGKAYLYVPGGGILNPGRPKLILNEFSL